MPFQSEKQRRYLWANEPEIARDWTDTYGSGIAKALGGRIQYQRGGPGPGGQGARGQATQNPGSGGSSHDRGGRQHQATATRQVAATRARDRHPPAQPVAHTVAPTAQYDDRIQRIAAQNQRTAALRGRASDQGFHQFLTPRTNYQKPTFGMRLRSGLGALGRGLGNLGNMAMMFNPYSAALGLAGKAGLGTMFNIGSRYANQGGNWLNEFRQYDNLMDYLNRNKNQTTEQMDPELAKYFSGTEGIMDPNILPEYEIDDSWYLS